MNAQNAQNHVMPIYRYGADYPIVKIYDDVHHNLITKITFLKNSLSLPSVQIGLGSRSLLSISSHPTKNALPFSVLYDILAEFGFDFPIYSSHEMINHLWLLDEAKNPESLRDGYIPLTYSGSEIISYDNLTDSLKFLTNHHWIKLHFSEKYCFMSNPAANSLIAAAKSLI